MGLMNAAETNTVLPFTMEDRDRFFVSQNQLLDKLVERNTLGDSGFTLMPFNGHETERLINAPEIDPLKLSLNFDLEWSFEFQQALAKEDKDWNYLSGSETPTFMVMPVEDALDSVNRYEMPRLLSTKLVHCLPASGFVLVKWFWSGCSLLWCLEDAHGDTWHCLGRCKDRFETLQAVKRILPRLDGDSVGEDYFVCKDQIWLPKEYGLLNGFLGTA